MVTFDGFAAHAQTLTWGIVAVAILGLIGYLYTVVRR